MVSMAASAALKTSSSSQAAFVPRPGQLGRHVVRRLAPGGHGGHAQLEPLRRGARRSSSTRACEDARHRPVRRQQPQVRQRAHLGQRGQEVAQRLLGVRRLEADRGRDRRQHVVAGEEQRRPPGRRTRSGPGCGPGSRPRRACAARRSMPLVAVEPLVGHALSVDRSGAPRRGHRAPPLGELLRRRRRSSRSHGSGRSSRASLCIRSIVALSPRPRRRARRPRGRRPRPACSGRGACA